MKFMFFEVGSTDGSSDGSIVGSTVGSKDGSTVGLTVGSSFRKWLVDEGKNKYHGWINTWVKRWIYGGIDCRINAGVNGWV